MLQRLSILLVLVFFSFAVNANTTPVIDGFKIEKGVHYKIVPSVQSGFKNQVTEVFYYGCGHCYNLEPSRKKWLKHKPKDVKFVAVPALFPNSHWKFMAQVFYTAKRLGILDKFHTKYFNAIHKEGRTLNSLEKLQEFVKPMGVSAKDYADMFNSFQVAQDLSEAMSLTKSFGIDGVPSIIVNGKYITDVSMAGSRVNLWRVVDYLLKQ